MAKTTCYKEELEKEMDRFMVNYAFRKYQYVLTPQKVHEIKTEPYWGQDVDVFCDYMLQVNFGETIPGTSNVKLPKTLKVYTEEEVCKMEVKSA
ncbi:hypothetical protein F5B19DRAFT_460428 [Rostrohypoxylon terebratum]|nr:hypothetical protein F5B19DRAFT_460428 [Rostrohypoxylon terebratum]